MDPAQAVISCQASAFLLNFRCRARWVGRNLFCRIPRDSPTFQALHADLSGSRPFASDPNDLEPGFFRSAPYADGLSRLIPAIEILDPRSHFADVKRARALHE